MKKMILIVAVAAFSVVAFAQEVSVSADLVSRYVWRGTQFSNAPAIQPGIDFTIGGFSAGTWGSYSFDNQSKLGAEVDLYAGYTFDFGLGVIVNDYFLPMDPNINDNEEYSSGGYFAKSNHTIEIGATYTTGALSFGAYKMISKEWSGYEAFYVEAGYAFNDNLSCTLGAGDKSYIIEYGDDLYDDKQASFNVCNIGLTYSKEVKLTETWKTTPFVSFILNPNQEQVFLVVGLTF